MSCLDQPSSVEIKIVDDIFIKSMEIQHKHMVVPQHSHKYDHVSMLALGTVRLWKDGVLMGDYKAPQGILIKAGCKHTFQSLEDNTIIYCIHRLHDTDEVEILEEHQFKGAS